MRLPIAILALLLAAPASLRAQALLDPTRPPDAVLAAQAKAAAVAQGVPAAAAVEADPSARLQMLNPSKQYAIIGGKVVKLGGMVDGAKLVEIRNDAIVLQTPEGAKETVSLYPGIRIRLVGKATVREDAHGDASKKEKR